MQFDVIDRRLHPLIDVIFNILVGESDHFFIEQTVAVIRSLLLQPLVFLLYLHLLIINYHRMEGSSTRRLNIIGQQITQADPLVKFDSKGRLITVTLNRPKALNSLNLEMVTILASNYDYVNSHAVVWMQGAGGKAFCAGGDVKVLFEKEATVESRLSFFRKEFELDYRVANLKALQVSCWDGIVMGGGVGLSVFAPFIIATENTVFAMPEVKIGFYTDVGSSHFLSRLRNSIGYYLGMTGASLKGEEVYLAGIANYFIPSKVLREVYNEVVAVCAQNRHNLRDDIASILKKYHVAPTTQLVAHQEEIKQLFALGSARAIYRQALKHPNNQFYSSIAKIYKSVCPASVELVHRLITIAKTMTLRQVFIHDYKILEHMAVNADFREGVRSVLIQKGSTPKWKSPDLLTLKEEDVQLFFKPVEGSRALQI